MSPTKTKPGTIVVLGIGNVLAGDEGIGVVAVRRLMNSDLANRVVFVDGGTGGFSLLSYLQDYERIIMIDAAADGRPPGTVTVLSPRFAQDFPRSLSAHDIGLRDLIEAASLLGALPEIELITISVEKLPLMSLEISDPVQKALPDVEEKLRSLLTKAKD